jgi:hypothetical protein
MKPWNATCPECNSANAYLGAHFYECPNVTCKNHTKKQKLAVEFEHALEAAANDDYDDEAKSKSLTTKNQGEFQFDDSDLDDLYNGYLYGVTSKTSGSVSASPAVAPTSQQEQDCDRYDTIYDFLGPGPPEEND